MDVRQLLEAVKKDEIDIDTAVNKLKDLPYEDLGYANIDHHRELRNGFPEVIYCEGKTDEHIIGIVDVLLKKQSNVLGTRCRKETAEKKNWQDRLHAVIDELNKEDNRRLILNAFYSVNPMQIDRFMQNYFRPAVEEILTEYIQDVDISEENREFMIRMYDLFWVDLVMRWIQTGMEISEMTGDIEKIMYVMTGSRQYIAQSLKAFENKDRKALRPAGEKNKKN